MHFATSDTSAFQESAFGKNPLMLFITITYERMPNLNPNDSINQLTHKIIGCAMQVHNFLGNGFQEVIYQRALAIEFDFQKINFVREQEMDLFYREQLIGTRRVDFFVEGLVMVEIKAVELLKEVHKAQAINYCEAYKIANGLLINFGASSLDFNRVYNKKML